MNELYLYPEAEAEVTAFLQDWTPSGQLQDHDALGSAELLTDFETAMMATYDLDWLMVCGDQLDDERLRLRNAAEARCGVPNRMLSARHSEDLSDRYEELIATVVARAPQIWQQTSFSDHLYATFNNIGGIRLVAGVLADSLHERLFAVYRAGGIPCGWSGSYPDGQLKIFHVAV